MGKPERFRVLLLVPVRQGSGGLALFPPIGLGYLAASLRRAGFGHVSILDCVLEGMDFAAFAGHLRQSRPDLVGVTSWSLSVREVKECLRIARSLGIRTVIGGPHPSALGEEALGEFLDADFAFRGEAEAGLPLLARHLAGETIALDAVPGLMWRDAGAVRSNPQAFEKDLDSLGQPAWDLIIPARYAAKGTLIQKRTACIVTTRGCPFPCTFCSAFVTAGRKLRLRSTESVVEEIKDLIYEYGIRRFVVFDENITLNKGHITSLCRRVIDEGLGVSFELPNGIRLDTLDLEVLELMRRAGFSERVAVGIESGSERVLRLMKKGLTKDEIRKKVALLNRAGFRPIGYFILGFPGETRQEMEETVSFAIELKLYRAGFMPYHPLPGTESYANLVSGGELPADFSWESLATDSVAYAPAGMTKEELDGIRRRAVLRFNLRPRVLWDYMRDYNSFVFALRKCGSVFLGKAPEGRHLSQASVN